MQNNRQVDRAKQFLPFDALKGFREALYEKEKIKEKRKEISQDREEELQGLFLKIKKGVRIVVQHYENLEYIETTGLVKKINAIEKKIFINNLWINYENIVGIHILEE